MKYTQLEIFNELKNYNCLKKKERKKIKQWCRIKYINKFTGEFKRGGLLFCVNENNIILQGFYKNKFNKPTRWAINFDDYIIFYKK